MQEQNGKLRPFVKWAGGKRQLLDSYGFFFPQNFNQYFEPFVGGGAVFFSLLEKNSLMPATIMDTNSELMSCYRVVKDEVEELISLLAGHKNRHCKDYYYEVRAWDTDSSFSKLSDVERAARLIYLNKTCFNGLYRVNSKGFYNVPFGRYKDPPILDAENLRNVSRAIQGVTILTTSFEGVLNYANASDFIYFDPPYQPISDTAHFTSYTSNNFGKDQQQLLRQVFEELDQRGCYVVLSNSYSDFIRELYNNLPGVQVEIIAANRAINRDIKKRGKIPEMLIVGKTLGQMLAMEKAQLL